MPAALASRRHDLDWIRAGAFALLIFYHLYCGQLLRAFIAGTCNKSHVWFRWFNELPVLVLFVIVFLVILKPF